MHTPVEKLKGSWSLLNKTEQIIHRQGQNSNIATQEMLASYHSTQHQATGVTPYEALMNKQVRTKRDAEYKHQKISWNAQDKNTKEHTSLIGDQVLMKRKKTNKRWTAFEPAFYIVAQVDGSSIPTVYKENSWWERCAPRKSV